MPGRLPLHHATGATAGLPDRAGLLRPVVAAQRGAHGRTRCGRSGDAAAAGDSTASSRPTRARSSSWATVRRSSTSARAASCSTQPSALSDSPRGQDGRRHHPRLRLQPHRPANVPWSHPYVPTCGPGRCTHRRAGGPLPRGARDLGVRGHAVIGVYVGDDKHQLEEIPRLLTRANQALQTLERYKHASQVTGPPCPRSRSRTS